MPQLSDTFIDRLIALTSQSGDIQYRQKLVDDYRKAMAYVIPAEQDVAFDEQTLSMMRSATGPTSAISASDIRAQIESTQADARQLVTSVNEIYEIVSRNLNPSTELYAVTAPPIVRTDRSTNPRNLILYGVVTMLVALLFIVGLCLIHNRVREEDAVLHAHETLPGSAAQRATG